MSHRPYPSADRALRQLGRHGRTTPELIPHQDSARAALESVARAMAPFSEAMRLTLDTWNRQVAHTLGGSAP
jgi:hypothetical protein